MNFLVGSTYLSPSDFPKHHEDVLQYVSHFISREGLPEHKVGYCVSFKLELQDTLSWWWIIFYQLQFTRILCLETSTRSSASRPNPFLFSLGDGGGRTSGSASRGPPKDFLAKLIYISQRPLAWHSSSEGKQGDSWEGVIMWESSSCHCQPGAASIVILVSPFLGCLSRGLAGTIHLGCQFC